MSASPAGPTPGRTPNGAARPPHRPHPRNTANPLMQKKKVHRPRPQGAPGQRQGGAGQTKPTTQMSEEPRDLVAMPFGDTAPSLFSEKNPLAPGTYTDFPVVMTKKALMEGLQHHVARFASRKPVELLNEDQFEPPLYLLRQDVRAPLPGTPEWAEMEADMARRLTEGADDAERNAAKDAVKAEIAPSLAKKKAKPIKKKQKEARTKNDSEAHKRKWQLKYEESMPWHLEDAEKKSIWMGSYEAASSDVWTQLKYEETTNGPRFVITPLQKWYKFGPKTRADPEMMKLNAAREKKAGPNHSFMDAFVKAEHDRAAEEQDFKNGLTGGGKRLFAGRFKGIDELRNDEELDFEEDWADDEAPAAIEGDETEIKEVEHKLKRDQLKANFFGQRSNADYLADEERELRERELLKEIGRKTAKALVKRERNAIYQDNLFSDNSDDTDTDAEIEREKERKEAEAKAEAAAAAPKIKSEPGSRNNTPGHRPGKHPEPLPRAAQNLKRPGSPGLSDASGNESTAARKKAKLKNPLTKLAAGGPSRSGSPAPSINGGRPGPAHNRSFAAGSGSDTEGGGPRRLKLTSPRSPSGSPGPSRLQSRAGSVAPKDPTKRDFPKTAAELRPLIPESGITMSEVVRQFRVSGKDQQKRLIGMVREIALYDRVTGILRPKPRAPGQ